MAVKIRLSRIGAKKKPFYRIVVADGRTPRDGRQIEVVGTYDPKSGLKKAVVKADRIRHWIETGARPTGIVVQILKAVQHP